MTTAATNKNLVPPDGGWGYMVCIGLIFITGTPMWTVSSFGLIFNELLIEDGKNSNVMPIIAGLCGFMIAASGLMVSTMMRWFSLRQIALIGTALQTLTWVLNMFVTRPEYLIATQGVVYGAALGLTQTSGFILFNAYFRRNRVMAMSMCASAIGLGGIAFPLFVEWCARYYGFRGTLLILTAVSLHAVMGAILFQPVEWHMIPGEDATGDNLNITQLEPLMEMKNIESLKTVDESPKSRWSDFLEKTDLRLFKKLTFCNICVGMGFGLKSDKQVATCLAIISFTDLLSRIMLGFASKRFRINSYYMFYAAMIMISIARFAFLQIDGFVGVCIIQSMLGFMKAWNWILFPLLVAEELPNENQSSAFGIAQSSTFLFNVIYTSASGFTLLLTGSYKLTFYILALSGLLPIIPWSVELFIVRPSKKRSKAI